MDPISTAIITAIPAIAGKVGGQMVSDAYDALKGKIKQLFGEQHAVVTALQGVEQNPASDGRKLTLQEEIAASGLDRDAEIMKLASALSELMKNHGGTYGGNTIHVVTANHSTIIGSQHNHN
ncbi:MAG: hypothetical protein HQL99_04310 [Magnetococcales bacterium]|nr:hypothetical protein [Magnetococcales bacterium]